MSTALQSSNRYFNRKERFSRVAPMLSPSKKRGTEAMLLHAASDARSIRTADYFSLASSTQVRSAMAIVRSSDFMYSASFSSCVGCTAK